MSTQRWDGLAGKSEQTCIVSGLELPPRVAQPTALINVGPDLSRDQEGRRDMARVPQRQDMLQARGFRV